MFPELTCMKKFIQRPAIGGLEALLKLRTHAALSKDLVKVALTPKILVPKAQSSLTERRCGHHGIRMGNCSGLLADISLGRILRSTACSSSAASDESTMLNNSNSAHAQRLSEPHALQFPRLWTLRNRSAMPFLRWELEHEPCPAH